MTEDKKKNPPKSKDEQIKDEVVKEILALNEGRAGDAQKRPNMALLAIGEGKNKFVDNLVEEAKAVGIDTHVYKCPIDSEADELKAMIECLNDDDILDGIYLDLPLPGGFPADELLDQIASDKELNFVLDSVERDDALREALLFKEVLEKYKTKI